MSNDGKLVNLVLSGGGIKGIAYAGVLDVLEQRGYQCANIAGVSAGALAGAFIGAGFNADEVKRIVYTFDFGKIAVGEIPQKVPAVARYMQYERKYADTRGRTIEDFLNIRHETGSMLLSGSGPAFLETRGNALKNIITLSKEGCLYDGDYLEEWVHDVLAKKGIKTFADLKGGIKDKVNPQGYKVRITAVDAMRGKMVILPDDIAFYGIEPDQLEVAKAVRMSTSVPFAFKPVEMKKWEANKVKTYYLVDGGVFDSFPYWLIDNMRYPHTLGLRIASESKNKLFTLDTPLSILKGLISGVQDIGIPKNAYKTEFIAKIDTAKVSFLDFNLEQEEKNYLFNAGKGAATKLLDLFEQKHRNLLSNFIMHRILGHRIW